MFCLVEVTIILFLFDTSILFFSFSFPLLVLRVVGLVPFLVVDLVPFFFFNLFCFFFKVIELAILFVFITALDFNKDPFGCLKMLLFLFLNSLKNFYSYLPIHNLTYFQYFFLFQNNLIIFHILHS